MSFGERLAAARRRANITQENFARVLGVSRQAVSKWESDLALPEAEKLPRIAQILGISLDELMGMEGTATERPQQKESVAPTITLHLGTSFEYKSKKTIRGVPLVHVNFGFGKKARGVVAIGNNATGVIALGLLAKGVLPFGLLALGVMPYGVLAVGLAAFGSVALGLFAAGAIACGLFAMGAIAIGCYAVGALAIGAYGALGDQAVSSLGVAIGKTFAEGCYPLFPQAAFDKESISPLIDRVRDAAPLPLRPLAALFAAFLTALS